MGGFYLLRHAQSAPSEHETSEWPLTPRGEQQAEAAVEVLAKLGITDIISSPFKRARSTALPVARALGLPLQIDERLRERDVSGTLLPDFMEVMKRSFQDLDFCLPGRESSRACQNRICAAIKEISAREGTPVIVGHGNAFTLFLMTLDSSFGFERWRAMPNPALFFVGERVEAIALDDQS